MHGKQRGDFGGSRRRARGVFTRLGLLSFFITSLAWAAPGGEAWERTLVPAELKQYMEDRNHNWVLEEVRQAEIVSEAEFAERVRASNTRLLGMGFNGIALVGAKDGQSYKFSHLSMKDPAFNSKWKPFLSTILGENFSPPVWQLIVWESLKKVGHLRREIQGSVLWRAYDPAGLDIPSLVSSDHLAYRRAYISGTPLDKILASERTPGDRLHESYDKKALWEKLAELQKHAQKMLFDYGVVVDFANPGNFIVQGTGSVLKIIAVDHELLAPTEATREYYRKHGVEIPRLNVPGWDQLVHWPLVPHHLATNLNWDLNFKQVLDYIDAYHDLKGNRRRALEILAEQPEVKVELVPGRDNFGALHMAKLLLRYMPKPSCAGLLGTGPESK